QKSSKCRECAGGRRVGVRLMVLARRVMGLVRIAHLSWRAGRKVIFVQYPCQMNFHFLLPGRVCRGSRVEVFAKTCLAATRGWQRAGEPPTGSKSPIERKLAPRAFPSVA